MQGCFEVTENDKSKYDINCALISKYSEDGVCKEQLDLYKLIEEACSIIKSLEKTADKVKRSYFEKILSLAQVGLTGPNAQPELALASLKSLKQDIVIKESGRIKNKYMISLGIWSVSLIFVGLLALIITNYFKVYTIEKYIYTFIGAMIGTWVSFGARKVELKFEELSVIEKDRLNHILRLIFVGISSNILLLFISSGIFEFSIGGLGSKEILDSKELQVLVGIIFGLIEYKLAIGLFNKANDIIKI